MCVQLERFLISNRDDYLLHSSKNYTSEQKQFNNWLTNRLLEVAASHNYVFDPDEFNFVAIRDRIRCYYKSYVQTARKKGVSIPLIAKPRAAKKAKTEDGEGGDAETSKSEDKEKAGATGEQAENGKENMKAE